MGVEKIRAVITCEHAGHIVPSSYQSIFQGKERIVSSHQGFDRGALSVARMLSRSFSLPLFYSLITRLIIDTNRSPKNPALFTKLSRQLGLEEKERLMRLYYWSHRDAVEREVDLLSSSGKVLHIAVHSFVPRLRGKSRTADIGLLYDPSRMGEKALSARWIRRIKLIAPALSVRRNYPYRGISDGLTSFLRKRYGPAIYWGIEVEINQRVIENRAKKNMVLRSLKEGLIGALADLNCTFEE